MDRARLRFPLCSSFTVALEPEDVSILSFRARRNEDMIVIRLRKSLRGY
jgi:hypothetical protein